MPAHGTGGARATLEFNNSPSAKKNQVKPASKRAKMKGVEGRNFCPSVETKPCHPAYSEQGPAKKFSFPSRRKGNRPPNQKMRRKLFCGIASETRRLPIPCAFLKCGPNGNRTHISAMRKQ